MTMGLQFGYCIYTQHWIQKQFSENAGYRPPTRSCTMHRLVASTQPPVAYGTWRREGQMKNLVAGRLEDLTLLLGRLTTGSRDFK